MRRLLRTDSVREYQKTQIHSDRYIRSIIAHSSQKEEHERVSLPNTPPFCHPTSSPEVKVKTNKCQQYVSGEVEQLKKKKGKKNKSIKNRNLASFTSFQEHAGQCSLARVDRGVDQLHKNLIKS